MMPGQCCLNKIEPYIVGLFLSSLTLPVLPFIPAQMSAEQKDFGDSAMGDGVHAIVSVEQPITVQDQSSQTTYHPKNGEKAAVMHGQYRMPGGRPRLRRLETCLFY